MPAYRSRRRSSTALSARAGSNVVDHAVQMHDENTDRSEAAATWSVDVKGTDRSTVAGGDAALCLPPQSVTLRQACELDVHTIEVRYIVMWLVFVAQQHEVVPDLTVLARKLAQTAAVPGVLVPGYLDVVVTGAGLATGTVAAGHQGEVEEWVGVGRSIHLDYGYLL